MTKRPKGRAYTGLFLRGGVIYYDRHAKGEPRTPFSTETNDWNEAA